ncbi:MAG: YfiR family protein [Bacteroidales bacterium]|nr:YfiR family protein [Bacteroidales bacterium]
MKRVRTVLLVTFISMLAWSTDAWAQTGISKAQAMFLYNFSRLVEWPASAKSGDFVIGILGNSSIVEELTAYTQGKR